MTQVYGDRVLETSTTTGTGPITLLGAVTGYRTFASVATNNGDRFIYVIWSNALWEVGKGTRTSATTFSRDTVYSSSNANALVNFIAGTKSVWMDISARQVQSIDTVDAPNLVINGGMEVSQFNGANSISSTGYTVDQFLIGKNHDGTVAVAQVVDAPVGLKNSVKMTVSVADASIGSSQLMFMSTYLEGLRVSRLQFGGANASPISLGFWVKAHRTGTYCIAIQNSALNRSYVLEYTVIAADTWEYKTVSLPGDTTGTWLSTNLIGLVITWAITAGSGLQTTAGSWAAGNFIATANQVNGVGLTSDTFQITGVNLIQGAVPVTADASTFKISLFADELRKCQRYYHTFPFSSGLLIGILHGADSATALSFGLTLGLPVKMRASPAVSNNPANFSINDQGATDTVTSISWNTSVDLISISSLTQTSAGFFVDADSICLQANTTTGISCDARL